MEISRSGWKWRAAVCAIAALLAVALGFAMPEFATLQATNWVLSGLLALSLTLVWGHAGIFSFGQGAFFGVGAYAYSIAAINWLPHTGETFSAVLVGALAGAAIAAAVGYFVFYGNVGDVYVGIITLALALVLFTVMSSTADPKYHLGDALFGGYNGISGVPPLTWPSAEGGDPLSAAQLFAVVVLVSAAVLAALYLLLDKPFGRIVTALRQNELRTQLLGFDARLRKLVVFALGGAIAGVAGAFYAAWAMFISPTVFGLALAAQVVIWVLVGGRMSLAGAFVGALVVQALSSTLGGGAGDATPIILGAVLIAVVLFLPQGAVPALARLARRRRGPAVPAASASSEAGDGMRQPELLPLARQARGAALGAADLVKSFGGVKAVQRATLDFSERGVHCLIGPNGAGKSTFFNLLVGRHVPDSGRVTLDGRSITRLKPHQRVQCGLGIKLQVASIFADLPVRENLWLAAYGRLREAAAARRRADELLQWLNLAARADELAGALSHGQKQWLEIGMVIASDPSVVLLDEPTAGMTRDETLRMAALIGQLGQHVSVVVVEHDMEFVRTLDVPVTVFHQGGVFASGSLDELRRDERILDIYLGRHGHTAA